MPKKSKQQPLRDAVTETFRGGRPVPDDLVRRFVAKIQRDRKRQADDRSSTERQMAEFLDKAGPSAKSTIGDADLRRAAGLLKIHERLGKQKLRAPKVAGKFGGVLPGRITVSVAAPFDYDIVIPTVLAGPEPDLVGNSDKNTGQMDASAISATTKGFGGGSMYTTVGIYFHPPGAGTLTVRAAPTFSFQWWTNSLRTTALVRSTGHGGLTVYGVDVASQTIGETGTIVATARNEFFGWNESQTEQVRFDFGFDVQAAVSAQLEVTRSLVYLLFVDAHVHVEGVGWPGSLAGAKLSVTVPSITYDFEAQQVFTTG